jgi:hypothetical protein
MTPHEGLHPSAWGFECLGRLLPVGGVELLQIARDALLICAMRRSILALVKFLSRLFSALNLPPSIAIPAIALRFATTVYQQMGFALVLLWAEIEEEDDEDPDDERTSKQHPADRKGRWADR